jgi:hypothetical protein
MSVAMEDVEPPQWAVDYWVNLARRTEAEDVIRDIRKFVDDELYVENSMAELGVEISPRWPGEKPAG